MLSIVKSMSLHGLEGYLTEVQVDVSARDAKLGSGWTSRCKCERVKRKSANSN